MRDLVVLRYLLKMLRLAVCLVGEEGVVVSLQEQTDLLDSLNESGELYFSFDEFSNRQHHALELRLQNARARVVPKEHGDVRVSLKVEAGILEEAALYVGGVNFVVPTAADLGQHWQPVHKDSRVRRALVVVVVFVVGKDFPSFDSDAPITADAQDVRLQTNDRRRSTATLLPLVASEKPDCGSC